MNPLKPVLNVHIIPIGLEIDRAVLPLEKTKVDRVYLLSQEEEVDVIKFFVKEVKKRIKEKFKLKEKEIINAYYGEWDDFQGIMSKICEIVRKEKTEGNKVFINISSGGKLLGIAGTLISSMYGANAYYVIPERYEMWRKEQETSGLKGIVMIPEYKIQPPTDELVYALWIIDKYGVTSQKNVARELVEKKLLRNRTEDGVEELSEQALHVLFRRKFLYPLEERDWVKRDGKRRGARIYLTKEGENVLKIFKRSNKFI